MPGSGLRGSDRGPNPTEVRFTVSFDLVAPTTDVEALSICDVRF